MFEIAGRLVAALDAGRPLVIATAVAIEGSAPRTVGTSMAFDGETVIGSIAGGCVEGAVVGVCEEVLATGVPQTVEYGFSDDDAFAVGLTCGGRLRIHVQPAVDALASALRLAASGAPAGFATVISGALLGPTQSAEPSLRASHGASHGASHRASYRAGASHRARQRIAAELAARITLAETSLSTVDCDGETFEVFFETSAPKPRMIIFGAMEFSAALANAAQVLGYRVTVCDPRPLFATAARFPGTEIVLGWPTLYLPSTTVDERTAICVLSHDARFDAEIIAQALALNVGFVGAMGSRITHERRVASLRERDVPHDQLARLRSPIGLDIGASTPEETAISILAEIIQARTAGSVGTAGTVGMAGSAGTAGMAVGAGNPRSLNAAPLSTTAGAIHRALSPTATANEPFSPS